MEKIKLAIIATEKELDAIKSIVDLPAAEMIKKGINPFKEIKKFYGLIEEMVQLRKCLTWAEQQGFNNQPPKFNPHGFVIEDVLQCCPFEHIMASLPENRVMFMDSGLWQIWKNDEFPPKDADASDFILCKQGANESFKNFIIRYILSEKDEEIRADILTSIYFLAT